MTDDIARQATVPHPPFPLYSKDGDTIWAGVDWLGNQFRVGDTVMYCISAGRGQMMALGEVLKIDVHTWKLWNGEQRGELRVQVRTSKTSGHWNNEARTRPAWVNAMNITAIPGLTSPTLAAGSANRLPPDRA